VKTSPFDLSRQFPPFGLAPSPMLKSLSIKNLAVIESLSLNFEKGFHVFTGETGAGKSVLMTALGLISGKRMSSAVLRDGADQAHVEALIDVKGLPEVQKSLNEMGLADEDEPELLIIKRQVTADGKGQVFINQQRATLSALKNLVDGVVDITSQHESLKVFDESQARVWLDQFLPNEKTLTDYQSQYRLVKKMNSDLEELKRKELEKVERLEWIGFQMKELSGLEIESAEAEEELVALKSRMKHQSVLENFGEFVQHHLSGGESSAYEKLTDLQREIGKKSVLTEMFDPVLEKIDQLKEQVQDLSYQIEEKLHHDTELSSSLSLEQIESQLHKSERLKQKYGPTLDDVLVKRDELEQEKSDLEANEFELKTLEKKLIREMEGVTSLAEALHKDRRKVSTKVEKLVSKELKDLLLESARFEVRVTDFSKSEMQISDFDLYGADQVSFWFSANPGLSLQPLTKVASGGEASRVFLALKSVFQRDQNFATLVFDEIDTGISGATSEVVGEKLRGLAGNRQVFCITHHASIASLADHHHLVKKEQSQKSTITRVCTLDDDEKVSEVARLLGGKTITKKNREFAGEMLSRRHIS
jgi:DNA repair protein RecN (Recombination protein N)